MATTTYDVANHPVSKRRANQSRSVFHQWFSRCREWNGVHLASRHVKNSDTITLLDASKTQHKIRLDGIDAPEKGQAFGDRSKQSLSALAFDRDAQAHCPKVDRYKREVCTVMVGRVGVGLEQVRRGMAWHFKRYEREQTPEARAAYAEAEQEARRDKRGLWRDPEPVPPWEWRATLPRRHGCLLQSRGRSRVISAVSHPAPRAG